MNRESHRSWRRQSALKRTLISLLLVLIAADLRGYQLVAITIESEALGSPEPTTSPFTVAEVPQIQGSGAGRV